MMLLYGLLATATYDFSGVSDGFVDQIKSVLSVGLPIGAAIVALLVGWRIMKRFMNPGFGPSDKDIEDGESRGGNYGGW
jgi:hypothetical protein